ncbi:hypothetical protein F5Y19DRAFT_469843 [Xylariaceae sp. FL1651]|nr:hypothetical protein F5Y19DRAFT_469843 [Xylariaceae sp. FL1651]
MYFRNHHHTNIQYKQHPDGSTDRHTTANPPANANLGAFTACAASSPRHGGTTVNYWGVPVAAPAQLLQPQAPRPPAPAPARSSLTWLFLAIQLLVAVFSSVVAYICGAIFSCACVCTPPPAAAAATAAAAGAIRTSRPVSAVAF